MRHHGPLAYMAGHPVAANLLMLILLVGGLLFAGTMKQEVFPDFQRDEISITLPYPGATPEDIEESLVIPVENAVETLDNIKKVRTEIQEGQAVMTVELIAGTDKNALAQDIKNEVDRIKGQFPAEAEVPVVSVPSGRKRGVSVVMAGDMAAQSLFTLGERLRSELLNHSVINQVEVAGLPQVEMAVLIQQATLEKYQLTLNDVANKIQAASLDRPNGTLQTTSGDIVLRTREKKVASVDIEKVPVLVSETGSVITVRELGTVKDGFAEEGGFAFYNGEAAILIDAYLVGSSPTAISEAVHEAVDAAASWLPEGVTIEVLSDQSTAFTERVNLLVKNGLTGLVLVFVVLALFLEIRLAFWVMTGIPIAFLGAFLLLPNLVSINMVSLFAFIIALGLVVDDAIIVGENVFHYRQKGLKPYEAAVKGVQNIATPLVFGVLTSIASFIPLYVMPGDVGKIFSVVPVVVIACFLMSLLEGLFILPAHLAGVKAATEEGARSVFARFQQGFSKGFDKTILKAYRPLLVLAVRYRYITLLAALMMMLVAMSYVASGRMGIEVFPSTDSDFARVSLVMPVGTPDEVVKKTALAIASRADEAAGGYADALIKGIYVSVGSGSTAQIQAYLAGTEVRAKTMSTEAFTTAWREQVGEVAGVDSLLFQSDAGGPGDGRSLSVQLSHSDPAVLKRASTRLTESLSGYDIVSDLDNGYKAGKTQYDFVLNARGYTLGITPQLLSQSIRQAVYGAEVERHQRGRHEMKVMVRLPEVERQSESQLWDLLIRTPSGEFVPMMEVVTIEKGAAFEKITRADSARVIEVAGSVTPRSRNNEVIADMKETLLLELVRDYPGLSYSFEGRNADMVESLGSLKTTFPIALFVMYALLAIPFRSYLLPFVVISSIPFGVIGAIIGHSVMGLTLSIVSMLGIVALSGIVVNASLVLVDRAEYYIKEGKLPVDAVLQASIDRFRPIIITTMTTFFGLMPITFEASQQAAILIPMAVSLSYGVVFASLITLLLVPALFIIVSDVIRVGSFGQHKLGDDLTG